MTCCWCHTESPRIRVLVERVVNAYTDALMARIDGDSAEEADAVNRLEAHLLNLIREVVGKDETNRLTKSPAFAVKVSDPAK